MEEGGLVTRSLLLEEHIFRGNGNGNGVSDADPEKHSSASATPVLFLSTLVTICGAMAFGCCVGYTSPAESGMREDLGLSVSAYSVFSSLPALGAIAGAVFSGKIADLIGRRTTMGLSEIFVILGWCAIAFSKDVWWVDIGMLSIGIGVGFLMYTEISMAATMAIIARTENEWMAFICNFRNLSSSCLNNAHSVRSNTNTDTNKM